MRIRKESIVNGLRQVVEVEDASIGSCLSTIRELDGSHQDKPSVIRTPEPKTELVLEPGTKLDILGSNRHMVLGQLTVDNSGHTTIEFFENDQKYQFSLSSGGSVYPFEPSVHDTRIHIVKR